MALRADHSTGGHKSFGARGRLLTSGLLISGVTGSALVASCSLGQALQGERVFLASLTGLVLLLLFLLMTLFGFVQLMEWSDPFSECADVHSLDGAPPVSTSNPR